MNYREFVLSKINPKLSGKDILINGALGLAGEAGEVVDLIKKIVYHDKPMDRDKLIDEIGDVRWYIELLVSYLDTSIEEIEAKNMEKLNKRYPSGFSPQASAERKDVYYRTENS